MTTDPTGDDPAYRDQAGHDHGSRTPHDHAGHDHGSHTPQDHGGHDHDDLAGHDHGHDDTGAVHADASVRVARHTDAAAVGVVQSVVWRAAYEGVVPHEVLDRFEPAAFASTWRRSLEAPPAGAFGLLVACAGPQVVGFAAVGPTQDPDADAETGELLGLCVHPEARRVGHGSRLVNAAMDSLTSAGAAKAHAWVLVTDEQTRAFLLTAGFDPDGAHRDRVVGPAGETAREVRLVVGLGDDPAAATGP